MLKKSPSEATINTKLTPSSIYHVVFLHRSLKKRPEDRYIVDLAMALQNNGHKVTFYTSELDQSDCLEEVNVRKCQFLKKKYLKKFCFSHCSAI